MQEVTIRAVPRPTEAKTAAGAAGGIDWVAWYDGLTEDERRILRDHVIHATPEDVKADDALRYFFIFHVDDLAHDQPPGSRRLLEAYRVVNALRGRDGVDDARRRAVRALLAAYQSYLRDNPFVQ